jgi:hypothetical protein
MMKGDEERGGKGIEKREKMM